MQNPQASSTVPTRGYLQAPQVQNERGRGSISLHDGRRALKGGEGIAAPSRPSRALLSPFPSLQGHAGRHPPRRCTHRSGLGHQLKAALAA